MPSIVAPRLSRSLKCIAGLIAFVNALAAPAASLSPHGEVRPGYVADSACANCHPATAADWRTSKHSQAMQAAEPGTVLANFADQKFTGASGATTFHVRQGLFSIASAGADGRSGEFPVAYTFGLRPLQQYLVPQAGGRLQAFTIAWDTARHRWFDLQADEPAKPGESLHWTGRYQGWNLMCAECHTTALRKGYDQQADVYKTTWAAPNVGCQACHGPGARHVAAAGQKRALRLPGYGLPFAAPLVDQCAACHARRTRLREETQTGGALLDNYQPDTLRPDLYHPDGQQLAEVFEYGSFRQSRMYQAGVTCADCHAMHSGKLLAEGNALCTRCHGATPNPAFPGLKARNYESPEHHFHVPGASGSQCVACHMPATNYMVVHGRRDHAIRIPRPDLSRQLQTPNACTTCHQDRDAAWASAVLERQFGKRSQPPHYGEILMAARERQPGGLDALAGLAVDAAQPGIVRATASELFGQLAPRRLPVATLRDPDPAVRSVAAMVVGAWQDERAVRLLLPLIDDPVRAVRIAAARSLLNFDQRLVPSAQRPTLRRALSDFVAAQTAMADMPAAQLNLANFHRQRRQLQQALVHYQRALQQDPGFLAARLELAEWLADENRFDEAEQLLRAGMAVTGSKAEVHYALGVLLARQGKRESAVEELRSARKLNPNDPGISRSLERIEEYK
ncbi:MAG: tetratricopeptide repeat protein [Azonexaceae bacterium]|nr:tetratricopeptide repeat protein [Azonexaceae bacterium]